jgi:integrase
MIRHNPTAGVPRLTDKGRRRKEPFNTEQVRKLLDVVEGEWKGVILLGYAAGMRLSDAVNLTWQSIDLDNGVIAFHQSKTQSSADEETIVGLHTDLEAWLRSQGVRQEGPIFPGLAGRRTGGSYGLSNEFRQIMERAGIISEPIRTKKGIRRTVRALSFHSLRHTAASHVFRARVVEESVKRVTGHGRNGVTGAGFDRRQAARAWGIAVRLREQAARFRVECDIAETYPESALALESPEQGIQTTARRLAVATNICATSLEGLIDALERYNAGVQIVHPWQV